MNNLYAILNLGGGVCTTTLLSHYYPDGPWWARLTLAGVAIGCFFVAIKSVK